MIEDEPGRTVRPFDEPAPIALPAEVADASADFRAALARVDAARAVLAAKHEQLAAARAADEAAARDAVARGEDPPPDTTAPAADGLARGQRAVPAAWALAREAQVSFLTVVADHFEELVALVDDRRRAVLSEAQRALDVLAEAIRESVALGDLTRELHIESIRARRPNFSPQRRTRRKDPAASVLDPVRSALGINDVAERPSCGERAA
jgi:hypothetical protein